MSARIDRTGQRFGRLVVLRHDPEKWSRLICRCDCGAEVRVGRGNLTEGRTLSCGCLSREGSRARGRQRARHGHTRMDTAGRQASRTYSSWNAMLGRCTNPRHHAFARYGRLGVSERWRSFEVFLADMGERPPGTSLDRIDNERGYEPGNCRWATAQEQQRNRRGQRLLTWEGVTLCIAAWGERIKTSGRCIAERLRAGWSIERALTEPVQQSRRNAQGDRETSDEIA
jgi:hypothetical protein